MKVLGLFSGIGGFELGLQRAGFTISKMCEIEAHCVKVLNRNFSGVEIENDVKTLIVKEGEFDLMCGGFPCQDISIAGKNKGLLNGDKSSLWRDFKRLLNEGRPKYGLIENVSALLGRGLETILQDLAEIGYDATWTTFDSKYFGVPQRRRRVYILAVRDGIKADSDILKFTERYSSEHRQKVRAVDQGFEWNFTKKPGIKYKFAYFTRQRSDQFAEIGLSSTLAKRDYKSFVDLVVHKGQIRRVSVHERMRLQGFPYHWLDGLGLTHQQLYSCNGMTTHVPEWIGREIFNYERSI